MITLVGRKVMFNPIFNGGVYQGNGIELIPQKNPQVDDNGQIMGTIWLDKHTEALVAGPLQLNGWHFVYLMPKSTLTLLDNDLMDTYDGNEINNPG
jgi:hypothetical protein